MKKSFLFLCILLISLSSFHAPPSLKLALVKYNGGGDWYSNPTSLSNLAKFCNENIGTSFDPDYATVEVGSPEIYSYPFLHITGHGNIIFSDAEAENLRNYLIGGGFLHIDDNFGLDPYIRVAMKKVFPELQFMELPFQHEIYNQTFKFKNGLPKIHKHDDKPAQGFGLIWEGRLVTFYSFECDLGDGWEDREVHQDSQEIRLNALRMGSNIIEYAFTES